MIFLKREWESLNKQVEKEENVKDLISKIRKETKIKIKGIEYLVKTKTWYSIEEDKNSEYLKCELSNNKVLVIIPDDELIYIGKIIDNMKFERISEKEIIFENKIFYKVGNGNQFILRIEFGNEDQVEGKCIFEDYENENNIISLGILPDKENTRADVFAEIINLDDVIID